MTFTQLEYIIAVDNTRHFARAAAQCFVTQPTLSMQIQKLEEELELLELDVELLELELNGQVARLPGGLFQRVGSA